MNLVFQDELTTIYQGDALEILPTLPSGSVDLALLDPPWMISQEVMIHRSMNPLKHYKYKGKDISLSFGKWDQQWESEEEYLKFTESWFEKIIKVCREGAHIISFFDVMKGSYLVEIARRHNCLARQVLTWKKTNPVPRARCVDFMSSLEYAFWFTLGTKSRKVATFNFELGQQPNFIEAPIPGHTSKVDGNRSHPCQKPVKVLSAWIAYLSNPSDLVLDPFMGSGATLVAARRLGRKALGIDLDPKYCEVAVKRIQAITKPMDLEIKNLTKETTR